jgi:hypothetical protein
MALGLLYGSPLRYLSPDWYATGARLAYWIEHEIPSFVGNVPVRYTEALFKVFGRHHVPDRIIEEAFLILEKKGIRFDFPPGWRVVAPLPPSRNGAPPPPQMREVSKGEADRMMKYTLEEYERRYVLAIRTNNAAGAEAIIAAVLELLWGMAKGYGKTRQASRHEKLAEWEEFNAAVNEALDRARTLQTHVRYLSREEITAMRNAPTPTALRNITFRIATQVTTRTRPPARRTRR